MSFGRKGFDLDTVKMLMNIFVRLIHQLTIVYEALIQLRDRTRTGAVPLGSQVCL